MPQQKRAKLKPYRLLPRALAATVKKMGKGWLGALVVLAWAVPLLTGCMEALQTGQPVGVAPPLLRPSPTVVATANPVTPAALSQAPPSNSTPAPATAAPTGRPPVTPTVSAASPLPSSAEPLPTLALHTPPPPSNEERWRAQQIDRQPFPAPQAYTTTGSELWWYDPVNQQSVILGRITGDFAAQAAFTLRGQGVPALEVPYHVNIGYRLTALSPALLDRIKLAGYGEWIETYVFATPSISPR